jgi:hypothetical protein
VDTQNHFYGHTAALAAYAGLSRPRHVAGLIQHGWTVSPPIPVNFGDFPGIEQDGRRTLFVWSHEARSWDPVQSSRPSVALGSPWAYLATAAGALEQARTTLGSGTLVMPIHGTRIIEIEGDQAALARHYAEVEGPCTVCLHIEDTGKPEVVGAWRAAGHTLVTAGARHDPLFLGRILGLVLRHQRLVANRAMTSVLYAASVGRDIGVYGDPLGLKADLVSQEHVRSTWPELHGERTDPVAAQAVAQRELGFQHLLAPDDLRAVLGWERRGLGPFAEYWAGAPARKALNVLGIGRRDEGSTESQVGASPMLWLRHPLSHLPKPLPRTAGRLDPLPEALPVG